MSEASFPLEVQALTRELTALIETTAGQLGTGLNADHSERALLDGMLEIGRKALELVLSQAGDGDIGEEFIIDDGDSREILHRSADLDGRRLLTVFGDVKIERYRYVGPNGVTRYALDAMLELSQKDTTPLRQEWIERFSIDGAYGKSVETFKELLGISMSARTAQGIIQHRAANAMEFRGQVTPEKVKKGNLVVAQFDDKGVRMLRDRESEDERRKRLDPGEKPNKKKMATVGVVYETEPFEHSVDAIASTKEPGERMQRPRAENKHSLARIGERDEVFEEIRREVDIRLRPLTILVLLVDGAEILETSCREWFGDIATHLLLLDFWHLREHLWDAAHALEPRDAGARDRWIEEQSLRLLAGKASTVIHGMRVAAGKKKLPIPRRQRVEKVANYMEERLHMLAYDKALILGAPIGSGAVEGACSHLVKDRMERTGMRWSKDGAQSVLDIRGIHISDLRDQHREYTHHQEMQQHAWFHEAPDPLPASGRAA